MNYQPLILTCDCGYRTPTVGRNGVQLSEAKIRAVFNRHSCASRTRPRYQLAAVPCPACGRPRLIKRTNNYKRRVCMECYAKRWRTIITQRHEEVDEMAVERLLMGLPVISTRAERQAAVARLAERGMSTRGIAKRLGISARTAGRLRVRAIADQMLYPGQVMAAPAGNRGLTPNLIASGNEAGMYLTHPPGVSHLVTGTDVDGVTTPELAVSL